MQLQTLLEHARDGDTAATCRLTVGSSRCTEYLGNKSFVDQKLTDLDSIAGSRSEGFWVETLARVQEQLEIDREFCAGFDETKKVDVEPLLWMSKAALTPRQKTVLATRLSGGQSRRLQIHFGSTREADFLLPQFVSENMPEFLLEGFAAHQPLALENLILMHSPSTMIDTQGPMVRLPNQQKFLAYALLYKRLFGIDALGLYVTRVMDKASESVPPDALTRLNLEVESEAQRWAKALGVAGLAVGSVLPVPPDPPDLLAACDG